MKNIIFILFTIISFNTFSQDDKIVISLYINNRPEFILYSNNHLIYKAEGPNTRYKSILLDSMEVSLIVDNINHSGIDSLKSEYWTNGYTGYHHSLDYNKLYINTSIVKKEIGTKGTLDKTRDSIAKAMYNQFPLTMEYVNSRKILPYSFVQLYDQLCEYENNKSKKWTPSHFEVEFEENYDFENDSSVIIKEWPNEWMQFFEIMDNNPTPFIDFQMPYKLYKKVTNWSNSIKENQVFMINGKAYFININEFVFPHEVMKTLPNNK